MASISTFVHKFKRLCAYVLRPGSRRYEPGAYWEGRHAQHGTSPEAVANQADEAEQRYAVQERQFLEFLAANGLSPAGLRCMEFGCGTGFWAQLLLREHASSYVGVDISKTAVANCRKRIPQGTFHCADVSGGEFSTGTPADLVMAIDVTQHVVEETKLARFLGNMPANVRPGGHIIVTSYTGFGDRYADPEEAESFGFIKIPKMRWVYTWDLPTIRRCLAGAELVADAPFWDKHILLFRRA